MGNNSGQSKGRKICLQRGVKCGESRPTSARAGSGQEGYPLLLFSCQLVKKRRRNMMIVPNPSLLQTKRDPFASGAPKSNLRVKVTVII
jgi:hypothetical protein